MPFLRRLQIRYPNGLDHIIVTAATPIADGSCQVVQFCFRNDTEAQATAADIIAFDRRVTEEDREGAGGHRLRCAARHGIRAYERHMPSDQPGLLMRRMLLELTGGARRDRADPPLRQPAGGRVALGARHSSGASSHVHSDRERPRSLMSEPEARGPEDHDAPLEWRAPSIYQAE